MDELMIGLIENLSNNKTIGIVIHNITNKSIGYTTLNNDFSNILNELINNRKKWNGDLNNINFLIYFNYELPIPFRLTEIKKLKGSMETILHESILILND